jgi:hypothetical protein
MGVSENGARPQKCNLKEKLISKCTIFSDKIMSTILDPCRDLDILFLTNLVCPNDLSASWGIKWDKIPIVGGLKGEKYRWSLDSEGNPPACAGKKSASCPTL